ncbi:hypothetical protein NIES39_L00780 [Arthrospira platensis NIES-39]|nr:hypothetical protein NIES39_L00780 [Arthrospira platensis NIES-39]
MGVILPPGREVVVGLALLVGSTMLNLLRLNTQLSLLTLPALKGRGFLGHRGVGT